MHSGCTRTAQCLLRAPSGTVPAVHPAVTPLLDRLDRVRAGSAPWLVPAGPHTVMLLEALQRRCITPLSTQTRTHCRRRLGRSRSMSTLPLVEHMCAGLQMGANPTVAMAARQLMPILMPTTTTPKVTISGLSPAGVVGTNPGLLQAEPCTCFGSCQHRHFRIQGVIITVVTMCRMTRRNVSAISVFTIRSQS